MGSGGVGGYFGARLAVGGSDVTFVARGPHLAAMLEHGLTIEGGPDEIHLRGVKAVEDPAAAGVVDLVIFTVKLWDTDAAIEKIRPIVDPNTVVISLQNGVLKDDDLTRAFGRARVMGGVCYIATTIARPGVIGQTGALQRLVFGEFDGEATPRASRFLDACLRGGIKAELSRTIRRDIWEKFVFLVALSGTTTAMRSAIGQIRANAQTRAFLLDMMREVVAVARAHGIDLPADYAEAQLKLADGLAPDMTSSMYRDLEHGNRLEVRWLSGSVVELGAAAGIATPLNRAIADILALHAGGADAPIGASARIPSG
jgi:2-dehydropantoate 2-reductase